MCTLPSHLFLLARLFPEPLQGHLGHFIAYLTVSWATKPSSVGTDLAPVTTWWSAGSLLRWYLVWKCRSTWSATPALSGDPTSAYPPFPSCADAYHRGYSNEAPPSLLLVSWSIHWWPGEKLVNIPSTPTTSALCLVSSATGLRLFWRASSSLTMRPSVSSSSWSAGRMRILWAPRPACHQTSFSSTPHSISSATQSLFKPPHKSFFAQ